MLSQVEQWATLASFVLSILAFFRVDHLVFRRGVGRVNFWDPRPSAREWTLLAFTVVGFVLLGLSFYTQSQQPKPQFQQYMTNWGIQADAHGVPLRATIVANGATLQDRASNYKVAAAVVRYDGTHDLLDTPNLRKSAVYDIPNEPIGLYIPLPADFLKGPGAVAFVLLAVPNGTSMDQFSTLREAKVHGVVILQQYFQGGG